MEQSSSMFDQQARIRQWIKFLLPSNRGDPSRRPLSQARTAHEAKEKRGGQRHGSVELHQLRARRNCAAAGLIFGLSSSPEVPVVAPNVPRQVPERKISGGLVISRRWSSEALQPPHALRSRARKTVVGSFKSRDRMCPPALSSFTAALIRSFCLSLQGPRPR